MNSDKNFLIGTSALIILIILDVLIIGYFIKESTVDPMSEFNKEWQECSKLALDIDKTVCQNSLIEKLGVKSE